MERKYSRGESGNVFSQGQVRDEKDGRCLGGTRLLPWWILLPHPNITNKGGSGWSLAFDYAGWKTIYMKISLYEKKRYLYGRNGQISMLVRHFPSIQHCPLTHTFSSCLPDLQNQPNTNAQKYCSTSKVYNFTKHLDKAFFTKHLDTSMWVVNIFNALGIIN